MYTISSRVTPSTRITMRSLQIFQRSVCNPLGLYPNRDVVCSSAASRGSHIIAQADRRHPNASAYSANRRRQQGDTETDRSQGQSSREPPSRNEYNPSGRRSSSSTPYRNSSRHSSKQSPKPSASDDFVVIGKADSGSYIQSAAELDDKEGGSFWAAAIDEDEYEDDYESDDEDQEYEESDGAVDNTQNDMMNDDAAIEEMSSILRDLAECLDDQEGESPDQAIWREIYTSTRSPDLYLGPLVLRNVTGKGRGVFTTAAAAAGELLLVTSPLTLLYCPEGATPENEDLADHLAAAVAATTGSSTTTAAAAAAAALAPWQQRALLQLRPPGDQSTAAAGDLPDLLHLLGEPADVAAAMQQQQQRGSGAGSSDADGKQQQQRVAKAPQPAAATAAVTSRLPSSDDIQKIVFANCTGEEFDDSALVLLRGSNSSGHLGVWPAAAMINHSCAPNAHALLIGDKLVVRASEAIPAGQELTISYLGPQLFAPAAVRQQQLREQWNFDCKCTRCKAEARYGSSSSSSSSSSGSGSSSSTTLQDLLLNTYHQCQDMAESVEAAVDEDDIPTLRRLQQQLLSMQQQIESCIRAAKPPTNARRWLQASVYDLYDLLSLCADQLPAPVLPNNKRNLKWYKNNKNARQSKAAAAAAAVDTEALAECARILAAVTAGSSAHIDLATEYMIRTEARFGDSHQESVDAVRLCNAAHTARYGPCSHGLLQLLIDTRAGAALL